MAVKKISQSNQVSIKKEEQLARFIETARKLGCDEDKERFEKSLGKIASYKPPKKESGTGLNKPKVPRKKPA